MPRLTWLHLSDLHAFSPDYSWDSGEVLRAVTRDLKEKLVRLYNIQPDLLFFTGDAAFGRQPGYTLVQQFDEAAAILHSIRDVFGDRLPAERCFLVPGNHDIDRDAVSEGAQLWQKALKSPNQLSELFEKNDPSRLLQRQQVMARFEEYRDFLKRHQFDHCGSAHPALIYAKTVEVNGLKIGVAGFNSSITCFQNGERGGLWMAARWQLNRLLPQLDGCDLKIALVHHPDSWLNEYEDKLFRLLSLDFDFVLHGHEHDNWIDPSQPAFPLKHARMAAAALYDRADRENGYSVCEWDSETRQPTIYLREYSRAGRGFRSREIPSVTDDRGRWPPRPDPPPLLNRDRQTPTVQSEQNTDPLAPAPLPDKHGFLIEEIVSTTLIAEDGDCRREVDLNQISIQQPLLAESTLKRVFVSSTTGYIDPDFVRAEVRNSNFSGFRPTFAANKPTELLLDFGRSLTENERFSLEYSWYSMNGFAMDQRQYRRQYSTSEMEELSHFPLLQPTKRLTLFVQFPAGFLAARDLDLRASLSARVFTVDADGVTQFGSRQAPMEKTPRPQVRFIPSLGLAFLMIENPSIGFSYGISWRVPPGVKLKGSRERLAPLEASLLAHRTVPDPKLESSLQTFFQGCYSLFHHYLIEPYEDEGGWSGEVNLDLMIFDNETRSLPMVSVYTFREGIPSRQEPLKTPLPYGVGVGGKAFKTNSPSLWLKIAPEDRTIPDPYIRLGEKDDHAVLLSIPLQNPDDRRYVYAILNLGSADPKCPVRRLADAPQMPDILRALVQGLSAMGLKVLSK